MKIDLSGKPFHFIGIGGIGMSALAYVLAKRQIPVSGSDLRCNHITQRLQSVGAQIFNEQEATNLDIFQLASSVSEPLPTVAVGTRKSPERSTGNSPKVLDLPQIVCSTAINSSNAEYRAALERGYPIFHRSDLLAALIQDYTSVAVAGTHGKTTTSSLIGYMLLEAGLDPTIIVGGEVNAWEGNAHLGQSRLLVAEADESDGTLAKYTPTLGIITNIELDHPDRYQNLEAVVSTFRKFASQCQVLIGSIDCETVRQELTPQISYSLDPNQGADYTVEQVDYHAHGTTAEVWERGQRLGTLQISLLGQHNLSNALAAVVVGRQLGLDFEAISGAIAGFQGAKRRFEVKGVRQGITFIDDYAHHPSELRATLAAARLQLDSSRQQRVVAVFQPHRYSRTLTFLDEFATAFSDADLVAITDIYSAGEANLAQISGQHLADAIAYHHPVVYKQDLTSLRYWLKEVLQPGDLAIFLGAGNLNQIIPPLLATYSN